MSTDTELSSIISDLTLFSRENFPVAPTRLGLAAALNARDGALAAVAHVVKDVMSDNLELTLGLEALSPVGKHVRALEAVPRLTNQPDWVRADDNLDTPLSSTVWGRIGLASQRALDGNDGIIIYGIEGDDIARKRVAACARITSYLTLLDPELRRAAHEYGIPGPIATLDPAHSGALYASAQTLLRATSDRHGTDQFGRPLENAPQLLDVRSLAALTDGLRTIGAQIDNAPNLAHRHVEELIRAGRQLSLLAAGQIRQGARPANERGADVIARMLDAHTRDLATLPLAAHVTNLVPSDTRPLAQAGRCLDFLLASDGIPFEQAPQMVNAITALTPALHRAVERSLASGLWAVIDNEGRPQLTATAALAIPGADRSQAVALGGVHRPALAERLEALARHGLKPPAPAVTASSPRRRVVASLLSQRAARR